VKVLPMGPRALLVDVGNLGDVRRLYEEVQRRRAAGDMPDLVEAVPAARTVLLQFAADVRTLADELPGWVLPASAASAGDLVTVPVRYDGPDLHDVARLSGLSVDEVIAIHSGTDLTVAFCGFSPGFGYLTGLPEVLHVPRRREPRSAVPANSVGIAGEFTGVYPRPSPGGWQLVGTALVDPWDERRDSPALFAPGDRVRFVRPADPAAPEPGSLRSS
jgi:KipI family sensor histidine kinase inhibitor